MWSKQLTPSINQRLAGQVFNSTTYKTLMELADALHATNTALSASVASLKTTTSNNTQPNLDETQPALPYAVNAVQKPAKNNGRP